MSADLVTFVSSVVSISLGLIFGPPLLRWLAKRGHL